MNLELSDDETTLLLVYLGREIDRLDYDLSRSEQRDFRRALAADVERLRAIHARLIQLIEGAQPSHSP